MFLIFIGSVFMLSMSRTARKLCSPALDGSGSRLCIVKPGGAMPRCACEVPSGALETRTTAMNAVTMRMSLSRRAAEVRTDDSPIATVVDELELEAIEVGVDAADQRRAGPLPDQTRVHDGVSGVSALEDDLVDAAHDLDPLV